MNPKQSAFRALCLFITPSASSHINEKVTQLTVVIEYGQSPAGEATKEGCCEGKKKNIYKALSMVCNPEKALSRSLVLLKAGTEPRACILLSAQ